MTIYKRKYAQQGIPLVPMLDILTILLIFFIVHTEFKQQVSVLHIDVPKTAHLSGETQSREGLLLEIGTQGEIALDGKILSLDELSDAMREAQGEKIMLAAAEGASLGLVVSVMDTLSKAGLEVEELPFRIDYASK